PLPPPCEASAVVGTSAAVASTVAIVFACIGLPPSRLPPTLGRGLRERGVRRIAAASRTTRRSDRNRDSGAAVRVTTPNEGRTDAQTCVRRRRRDGRRACRAPRRLWWGRRLLAGARRGAASWGASPAGAPRADYDRRMAETVVVGASGVEISRIGLG